MVFRFESRRNGAQAEKMDALLEAALRIETYKHECRFCERRFKLKCNCVRHERIHTNDKPHKCRICLKAFILKKNMQDHERVHTMEKPYECGSCSRRFSRRNSMVRHSRIHTGEKPYSCEHCHKSFAWKAYLKRHFLNAHVNGTKKKVGHEEKAPDSGLVGAKVRGVSLRSDVT